MISTTDAKNTNKTRDIYNINSTTAGHNVLEYFQDIYPTCEELIERYKSKFRVIKFAISLMVAYYHTVEDSVIYVAHQSHN